MTGITNFADKLPSYITSAETGKGWIGKGWIGDLVRRYHVQQWVTKNAPKLVTFGQNLAKPALSFGEGAVSLLFELFTIFVLVLLLLLEGPKMRRGVLSLFSPGQAREIQAVASQVNRSVVGYMLGNFTTSVICGLTVFISLLATGVPFPGLWALWVALVDFLPIIGGALAGIPVVLFATASKGLTAGIVVLVVFVVYTQIENHVLNPIIMSKTVRISPLLVLLSVLVGASIGAWVGGIFGGFVAALLSIPAAGALQVIVVEVWRLTGPPAAAEIDAIKPDGTVVAVETDRDDRGRRGHARRGRARRRNQNRSRTGPGFSGVDPGPSPAPVVHDVVQRPPPRPQVALVRLGVVPDRDRADRLLVVRHPERVAERLHRLGHDPEVDRAEPLVDHGLQDEQRRHPGVDVPERHRPARLVPVGPALVGLRVPVQVDPLARHRHDHRRRGLGRLGDRRARHRPEPLPVLRFGQREERLPLGEPGRRAAHRVAENPVERLLRDRLSR